MRRHLRVGATIGAALVATAALSACTNPYDPNQRALGGAALGAGTGAAIGAIAGGGRGAAIGALVGGAAGAVGGAATTPTPPPPGYYGGPPPGYYQQPPPGYYQGRRRAITAPAAARLRLLTRPTDDESGVSPRDTPVPFDVQALIASGAVRTRFTSSLLSACT